MQGSEQDWWRARRDRRESEHAPPGIAPHHHEVCSDAERPWFPQMVVCHVEMETAAAQASYQRLHENRPWHDGTFADWSKEPDEGHPYHFMHGVRIWVTETDLGLGGAFTSSENPYKDKEDARGDST